MEITGKLTICNRCGFKIFRKGDCIKEPPYGAYYWKDEDPIPEDWASFGNEHLCPNCAKEWKKAIAQRRDN